MSGGFLARARLARVVGLCQTGRVEIVGPVSSQKPAVILEVDSEHVILYRLPGLVYIFLRASGASDREPVLRRHSATAGDRGLELTRGIRHRACPTTVMNGFSNATRAGRPCPGVVRKSWRSGWTAI